MKSKLFSILFALVLAVSLMLVSAAADASSITGAVTLVAEGDSTAEWTDEEAMVDDHSARLTMPNRNWYIEPISNAEAQIDVEDIRVGDITGFSFWQKVDNVDLPLCIEFNLNDGTVIRGYGLDRSKFPGGDAPHTDWFQVNESDISFGWPPSWDYYKSNYSDYIVESIYIGYGPIGSTQSVTAYVDDFALNEATYVFEPPLGPSDVLDHFTCYEVKEPKDLPKFEERDVVVTDQFGEEALTVKKPKLICIPCSKDGSEIKNPEIFILKLYQIKEPKDSPKFEPRDVLVTDQFGEEVLTVKKPKYLAVPALKEHTE